MSHGMTIHEELLNCFGCKYLLCAALCLASTAFVMSQESGDPSLAAATARASREVGEAKNDIEQHADERLFARLFSGVDNEVLHWENFKRTFDSGGFMTTDVQTASFRNAQAGRACSEAFLVLEQVSPRVVLEEATEGDAEAQVARRRVLVCQLSNSMDATVRSGLSDSVGDYMLVREEPHSSFKGHRIIGADVDVLRVYLFLDRLFRNSDLPKGMVPTIAHDLGGYLFANADYFSNPDPDVEIEKADSDAVKAASKALMATIVEAAERKGTPRIVSRDLAFYESLAEDD